MQHMSLDSSICRVFFFFLSLTKVRRGLESYSLYSVLFFSCLGFHKKVIFLLKSSGEVFTGEDAGINSLQIGNVSVCVYMYDPDHHG